MVLTEAQKKQAAEALVIAKESGKKKMWTTITNIKFGGSDIQRMVFMAMFGSIIFFFVCFIVLMILGLLFGFPIVGFADPQISKLKIDLLEKLPYPAMWMCVDRAIANKLNMNPKEPYSSCPVKGAEDCIGNTGNVMEPCVWGRSWILHRDEPMASLESGNAKCLPWVRGTPLALHLETWISDIRDSLDEASGRQGTNPFMCMVANEDLKLNDYMKNPFTIDLRWDTGVPLGRASGYMGIADRQMDKYGVVKSPPVWTKQRSRIFLMNTWTTQDLTLDTIRHHKIYMNEYHVRTSTVQDKLLSSSAAAFGKDKTNGARLQFQTDSFVSKQISVKQKSFADVAKEIGGIWSAMMLILGLFFIKEQATHKDGVIANSYSVFVFRWAKRKLKEGYAKTAIEQYMQRRRLQEDEKAGKETQMA